MNSDVSATSLDVALEIVLLRGVEYVAGRVQKDHGTISRQVLRGERSGVFGSVDGEPIFLSELSDGGAADSDGTVAEPGRLGEDEHARFLAARGDRDGDRSEQKRERDESLHERSRAMVTTSVHLTSGPNCVHIAGLRQTMVIIIILLVAAQL